MSEKLKTRKIRRQLLDIERQCGKLYADFLEWENAFPQSIRGAMELDLSELTRMRLQALTLLDELKKWELR